MQCEMCGKQVQRTHRVLIDGAVLNLCPSCSRFGKILDVKEETKSIKYVTRTPITHHVNKTVRETRRHWVKKENVESLEIEPDYPSIIKEAREKLGWTHEELANKLQEKKNLIGKIERGELMPSIKLARKIEKLLNVKLLEQL